MTSGVSSGATSGSSGTNLTYWRGAEHTNERKFTTLNRNQQKIKSNPILRTRSFQVTQQQKLSAFTPSENSAFREPVQSQFQPGKFLTSTPVKSLGRETEARKRRAQQFRNCFNPPTLSAFQPGPGKCCDGCWVVQCYCNAPTLLGGPESYQLLSDPFL